MNYQLITSDETLGHALAQLPPEAAIAVDTEFMRRNTFYPQIALLQLYAGGDLLLVDPLAISDTSAIRALLSEDPRIKILHSGSEDLEVFSRWLGALPTPMVDTQRAAALVGEDHGMGYRAIVERLLGVELEKGETRSDWLRRPLTDSQCHYAALDVLHLLPLWEILRQRADEQGRLEWVLEESAELALSMAERERQPFRRIKGAGRLNQRELAVLAGLSAWRETRARESDKPRGWILDDKACVDLARAMPDSDDALAALDALPPKLLRRRGSELLAVIEAALHADEASWPAPFPNPLAPPQRQQLKSLKASARERAEEIGVAPEILLPAADLELLVREASGESIDTPARWSGWRAGAVIEPLRKKAA